MKQIQTTANEMLSRGYESANEIFYNNEIRLNNEIILLPIKLFCYEITSLAYEIRY
jgi:hypothetical protein